MPEEKVAYSSQELAEFKAIINSKLKETKDALKDLKEVMKQSVDDNHRLTSDDSMEKEDYEQVTVQAQRLNLFAKRLEVALERIKQGTYGVCVVTGKLIPADRLRIVPHTTHSVEAKESGF